MHAYYHTRRHDSAALSWKHEAISKTLPLLYLRIHGYDCEDVERLYRMSRLGLIAAIPGKGLTNGLLLRRAAECVTVTREDECLTSNKAYSFFLPCRARGDTAEICATTVFLCTLKHARKKWTSSCTRASWWTVIDAIRSKLSGSFVRDIIEWLISSGLQWS